MVNIKKGSIFDSKCDLIIIPCDSYGSTTSFVSKQLRSNDFPSAPAINPGDVYYVDLFRSSFSNASVVGFAASVDGNLVHSSKGLITSISESIKNYCRDNNSISIVNMPLLGTGAGGLLPEESYEAIKNVFGDLPSIAVNVYVINESSYINLTKRFPKQSKRIKNPRVFISYTGTDINNRIWVKELATKLRASGVDARVDMFHLKPGQDLPQWMTNELIKADKVLIICDKYYAEKADMRNGGVGWETMIIQGDMLANQEQHKYITITRDKELDKSLPLYVKSKYTLTWSACGPTENEFKELMLHLFDCNTEPPLGEIPEYVENSLNQ